MSRTLVRNRLCISDEDFVVAYCKAPHLKALVTQLGVPEHTVRNRIQALRRKKVRLPDKPRSPRELSYDSETVDRLNQLVAQHSSGPAQ